jgi:hypothetical protein
LSKETTLNTLLQERISRRAFIRDLGAMAAGVAAVSAMPAVVAQAAEGEAATPVVTPQADGGIKSIAPSSADEVVLADGFKYQVLIKRGDVFTKDGKTFGDANDWTGWFPLEGKPNEGLLVVNNEYFFPGVLHGYETNAEGGDTKKTPEQIRMEKEHTGVSIVHIRKTGDQWSVVTDSDYATRWDGTGPKIALTGPVAGTASVKGATEVVGTAFNCAGGVTPWGTAFSCEEDYYLGYGEDSVNEVEIGDTYRWVDDPATAQPPEHYGWALEIDPVTGKAVKHTALGRFLHEAIVIGIGSTGKAVIYMTDDDNDHCFYKFISKNNYDPKNREANLKLFEEGTLYVAAFRDGEWLPVVWEGNEETLGNPDNVGGYKLTNQADVLTYCHRAAIALGGTPTDRPEGIAMHPVTKDIFVAFTNNNDHGNVHGHITVITETNKDHESLTFDWDIFATGGRRGGFSSPDNITFDAKGNLWMVTDVSGSRLNKGVFSFHGNNALFMFPTEGDDYGKGVRVGSGPVEAEFTGPSWYDAKTLFLSVQHPGENTEVNEKWTSHWPDGGDSLPRSAVIVITGPFPAAG